MAKSLLKPFHLAALAHIVGIFRGNRQKFLAPGEDSEFLG
jgi:hypothetical protein